MGSREIQAHFLLHMCVCSCVGVSLWSKFGEQAQTRTLAYMQRIRSKHHETMQRTVKPTLVRCVYVCLLPLCCGHFPFVVVVVGFFISGNTITIPLAGEFSHIRWLYFSPFIVCAPCFSSSPLLCLLPHSFVSLFLVCGMITSKLFHNFSLSNFSLLLLLVSLSPPPTFLLFIHRHTADQIDKINNNDHYLFAA